MRETTDRRQTHDTGLDTGGSPRLLPPPGGAGGAGGAGGPAAGGAGGARRRTARRRSGAALSLRDTFLSAIIRRYPGLRTEEAPHRLELCGGPRCSGRGAARLAAFVEETYGVRPGGVSASGRFTYRITGCMKNCPNGPSLRWDGALHSRADEALIRALVDEGGGRPSP